MSDLEGLPFRSAGNFLLERRGVVFRADRFAPSGDEGRTIGSGDVSRLLLDEKDMLIGVSEGRLPSLRQHRGG